MFFKNCSLLRQSKGSLNIFVYSSQDIQTEESTNGGPTGGLTGGLTDGLTTSQTRKALVLQWLKENPLNLLKNIKLAHWRLTKKMYICDLY